MQSRTISNEDIVDNFVTHLAHEGFSLVATVQRLEEMEALYDGTPLGAVYGKRAAQMEQAAGAMVRQLRVSR
jgi:hypothetical protein